MREANGRILKLAEQAGVVSLHTADDDPVRRTAAYPREFLHNRFVYVLVSPRARGYRLGSI